MPEFILDYGTPEAALRLTMLDDFTRGYIEALFFTSTGSPDDDELEHATVAELAPETWERITTDCARFQAENADLLASAYRRGGYDEEAAGRDFWYTRNGHGVGFWCRTQLEWESLGDRLSERCGWRTSFGEVGVYAGDDGLIYLD